MYGLLCITSALSCPQPIRGVGHGALVAPGPQRSLSFHLIKLYYNETSHNEINFNYLSVTDLGEKQH